jgi:hypothetical protein
MVRVFVWCRRGCDGDMYPSAVHVELAHSQIFTGSRSVYAKKTQPPSAGVYMREVDGSFYANRLFDPPVFV